MIAITYFILLAVVSSQVITRLVPYINNQAYFMGSRRRAFGIGALYSVGLFLVSLFTALVEYRFVLPPPAVDLAVCLLMISFPIAFIFALGLVAPDTYFYGSIGTACAAGLLLLVLNSACAALIVGVFSLMGLPVPG